MLDLPTLIVISCLPKLKRYMHQLLVFLLKLVQNQNKSSYSTSESAHQPLIFKFSFEILPFYLRMSIPTISTISYMSIAMLYVSNDNQFPKLL